VKKLRRIQTRKVLKTTNILNWIPKKLGRQISTSVKNDDASESKDDATELNDWNNEEEETSDDHQKSEELERKHDQDEETLDENIDKEDNDPVIADLIVTPDKEGMEDED
jgi:hypothetical protein